MSSPLKARGITGRKPGLRGQAYARKEKELTNAINRAEKKQLDEFLRARTEVVDRDIRDLRSRLHVDSPQRQSPELPVYGELVHSRAQSGHDPDDLHVAGVGTPSRSTHVRPYFLPIGCFTSHVASVFFVCCRQMVCGVQLQLELRVPERPPKMRDRQTSCSD